MCEADERDVDDIFKHFGAASAAATLQFSRSRTMRDIWRRQFSSCCVRSGFENLKIMKQRKPLDELMRTFFHVQFSHFIQEKLLMARAQRNITCILLTSYKNILST